MIFGYPSSSFNYKILKMEVRLRAFKAIHDPKSCDLFVQGHAKSLMNIGIDKLISSEDTWASNESVFVSVLESLDRTKVYGGMRLHLKEEDRLLPIEEAIGLLDPNIVNLVNTYAEFGTGETCGLWVSRKMAGCAVLLSYGCIAIAGRLGIKSIFSLCAPPTVKMGLNLGYEIVENIGDKGTLFYPNQNIISTIMLLKDVEYLNKATTENKEAILRLREESNYINVEKIKDREIKVHYEI